MVTGRDLSDFISHDVRAAECPRVCLTPALINFLGCLATLQVVSELRYCSLHFLEPDRPPKCLHQLLAQVCIR